MFGGITVEKIAKGWLSGPMYIVLGMRYIPTQVVNFICIVIVYLF